MSIIAVVTESVVVPCYNEEKNLPNLIERFAKIHEAGATWELILVNNGSVDGSARVFELELAKPGREFVRVVTVPSPNVGYGHGIMTGLHAAKGQRLGWTHADGQTPPSDVLKAFDLLQSSKDPQRTIVKGRRRNRPAKDALFTLGMEATATAILGKHLPDINGQPKAFPRALLELADRPPVDLSLDLYFLWIAKKNGFALETFDVHFGDREHGESKWAFNWKSKAKNIARSVKFMGALRMSGDYPHA
ncbi:MAG: glycosyltransferase family 2 protein [Polyangiaceae bacterium]